MPSLTQGPIKTSLSGCGGFTLEISIINYHFKKLKNTAWCYCDNCRKQPAILESIGVLIEWFQNCNMAWFRGLVHNNFRLATCSYRKLAVVSLKHVRNYVYHFLLEKRILFDEKSRCFEGWDSHPINEILPQHIKFFFIEFCRWTVKVLGRFS